ASALAAAAGYLDLAAFLGVGLFYTVFVAFVALAVRVVLQQVVTIGLTRGPAARLHAIARHRALVERRVRKAIDLVVVGLWMSIILGHFELLQPAETVLQGVLDARLRLGALDLPLAHVLSFVAGGVGAYLTERLGVAPRQGDV